jgi:hypothetical protein
MIIRELNARIRLTKFDDLFGDDASLPELDLTFKNILPNNVTQMKNTIVDIIIYTIFDFRLNIDVSVTSSNITGLIIYNNIAAIIITTNNIIPIL